MTTDKRCPKCGEIKPLCEFGKHRGNPDGFAYSCTECRADYRQEHRADIAAYNKQWNDDNASYHKQWYKKNPEKALAYVKRYHEQNREKRAAYMKQWRDENPNYKQQWVEANPEKPAEYDQRRRARKAHATVEKFDTQEVYERDGRICAYCGSTEDLTIDHIVPLARGGAHSPNNLTVACLGCNCSKGTKDLEEWLRSKEQLEQANI